MKRSKSNPESCVKIGQTVTVERDHLQALFVALRKKRYQVVGPTVRDEAIVYDELSQVSDLPQGWTDEQDGGHYRLKKRGDDALFGYAVGPHSWKKFLSPPLQRLWRAESRKGDLQIIEDNEEAPRFAFIGVRSCELHAISIQDKVFIQGTHMDPIYHARRENVFIVAVQCAQAGGTCFCVSMNAGPRAETGFDLAITEVLKDGRHYFVIETGTQKGAEVLKQMEHQPAAPGEKENAERVVSQAAALMGRTLDTTNIQSLIYNNLEHPRWDEVAGRCLTCANCTMVCPTCFCSTVEDVTDITGDHAERWRKWDSCFTMDFTHLGRGALRASPKSRYRQWLSHKLASWIDQFGTSGCVGCGRCITWCPVAIDLTEEVRAIRKTPTIPEDHQKKENTHGDA